MANPNSLKVDTGLERGDYFILPGRNGLPILGQVTNVRTLKRKRINVQKIGYLRFDAESGEYQGPQSVLRDDEEVHWFVVEGDRVPQKVEGEVNFVEHDLKVATRQIAKIDREIRDLKKSRRASIELANRLVTSSAH